MKILILGSEGFIGNHAVRHFSTLGFEVAGCDLFERTLHADYHYYKVSRLSPEWEEIFSGESFDYCINAAGSGNVPYSVSHPLIDFEANALDVIRILEAIRRFNRSCRYLHISSAAVYGNPALLPIREGDGKCPMSPYGWHKLIAEQICSEYHNLYQLPVSVIRPFSVYGEGLRKQLLWDICSKLQQADQVRLWGTGNESRDFIQVTDLVRLMHRIIEKSAFAGDVYNAASGVETSIREIANVFEQYYSGMKKIEFSGEVRVGDPVNWRADIERSRLLGFEPRIELREGIGSYIKWYHSATHK